jgi:hypothetical protein
VHSGPPNDYADLGPSLPSMDWIRTMPVGHPLASFRIKIFRSGQSCLPQGFAECNQRVSKESLSIEFATFVPPLAIIYMLVVPQVRLAHACDNWFHNFSRVSGFVNQPVYVGPHPNSADEDHHCLRYFASFFVLDALDGPLELALCIC